MTAWSLGWIATFHKDMSNERLFYSAVVKGWMNNDWSTKDIFGLVQHLSGRTV